MKKSHLLIALLAPSLAFGDAYQGKEDVKPDGPKTTVYNHQRQGALLPFKTWNSWDGKDRPCCWNGYGVDPSGANYWHYHNTETECYLGYDSAWEGTDHCKPEEEVDRTESIPEPEKPLLLGIGLLYFVWRRKCSRMNKD